MPFTYLDFERAARAYGAMGGFAHLATLVRELRAGRPVSLLLDGGDSWQGSRPSLWTKGQDMIDAQKLLGVDVMTAHWEFTYGAERVKEVVDKGLCRQDRLRRAERAHCGFRRPVFPRIRDPRDQQDPGRDRGAGLPVHAHRESALLRRRVDVRHQRGNFAKGRRRGARQRRARGGAVVAQRHGRRFETRSRVSPASMRS
jgi:hypothetical protein